MDPSRIRGSQTVSRDSKKKTRIRSVLKVLSRLCGNCEDHFYHLFIYLISCLIIGRLIYATGKRAAPRGPVEKDIVRAVVDLRNDERREEWLRRETKPEYAFDVCLPSSIGQRWQRGDAPVGAIVSKSE